MMTKFKLPLFTVCQCSAMLVVVVFGIAPADADDQPTADSIRPFFTQYCQSCHGADKAQADLRLNRLEPPAHSEKTTSVWKDVMDQLILQSMPPENAPQPTDEERGKVILAIQDSVRAAMRTRQGTGGRVVLRRLNRREYENTVADLLQLPKYVAQQATRSFPPDGEAFGFDNIGSSLNVTSVHLDKYVEAADYLLDRALVSGAEPKPFRFEFVPHLRLLEMRERDLEASKKYILSGETERLSRARGTVKRLEPLVPVMREEIRKHGPKPWYIRPRFDNLPRLVGKARVETTFGEPFVAKVMLDENDKPINSYNDFHLGSALSFPGGVSIPNDGTYRISAKLGRRGESKSPQTFVMSMDKGHKNDWRQVAFWQVDTPLEDIAKANYETSVYLERGSYGIWCTEHITFQREVFRDGEQTGQVFLLSFQINGPRGDEWPPPSYSRIISVRQPHETDRNYVREILRRFARQAYRRTVRDDELDRLVGIMDRQLAAGMPCEDAVRAALRYVLSSPSFLYLAEFPRNATGNDTFEVDDFALASRLSYFLWCTLPDETLLNLAEQNRLHEPAVLHDQVERLLDDPRSSEFVSGFSHQWLNLKSLDVRNPDIEKYPHFDEHLRTSMLRETDAFFAELLATNLSVENFLASDFVMLNERLAVHYGIDGVRGDVIRRVPLGPELHRGGVLGQASVLTATSTDVRTSPVTRGAFVLERLLGYPRPIPPANVPDLAEVPDEKDGRPITLAEKMELHRSQASCLNCHRLIDPLGLALENFDAIGAWRTDAGHPLFGGGWRSGNDIAAAGQLPKSHASFENPRDFRVALLKTEPHRLAHSLTEHLLTYALGRALDVVDREDTERIVKRLEDHGNGLRELIHLITQSPLMRRK